MKIQQLFLHNVRSIKSLDLDFRDPMTGKPMSRIVLAGANGSGKTTILECIFGLLAAAGKYGGGGLDRFSQLQEVAFTLSTTAQLKLIFEVGFPGNLPVELIVHYGAQKKLVEQLPTGSEEAIVGGNLPRVAPGIEWSGAPLEGSLFRQLASLIQSAKEREVDAPGSVLYFPHNRFLPSVEPGELRYEPRVYQWAYRYKPSDDWQGSTASYLFSLNYLDLEDRDRDRNMPANRFRQTVELVNSILVDKRVARIEKGRVVVETTNGQTHGLNDLSSGEKQLVLMLIEIARRVVPGSVILIDEPEISLHPAWQRGLVVALDKIIEQYDAQVIMATHSPEIAGMVLPHEVKFLSDLNAPLGEWKPEDEVLA